MLCAGRIYQVLALGRQTNCLMGVVRVTWSVFKILAPIISLKRVKLGT